MTSRAQAAFSALALLAFSNAGLAASNRVQELMVQARANAAAPTRVATSRAELPEWGGDEVIVNIGAYDFIGASSTGDSFGDDGNGYRYLISSTSGGYMAAPVRVPTGAVIDFVILSVCTSATGGLTAALFDGGEFGDPVTLLGSLTTVDHSLCFVQFQTMSHLYDNSNGHPLYVVIHWEGPTDGTLKFNAAGVQYHLTVSPGPATATFNDVPTSHPFFQYVEALAASGITAGCGNNNFCPDQPLTRGQMAVFLSKALGLRWPG